jgi:hypothetical protein
LLVLKSRASTEHLNGFARKNVPAHADHIDVGNSASRDSLITAPKRPNKKLLDDD